MVVVAIFGACARERSFERTRLGRHMDEHAISMDRHWNNSVDHHWFCVVLERLVG